MYSHTHAPFRPVSVVVALLWACCSGPAPAEAGGISKVWRTVYERLHSGESAPWRGKEDAVAWARGERDRVEPIVMRIIRGDEPDIQWTAGLSIARHIPSPAICELLVGKSRRIIDGAPDERLIPNSTDERGLINILDILARERHEAVRSLVRELAAQPEQSSLVIEHCLGALRYVGTKEDLQVVVQIASRHMSPHIDRQCGMTEKLIQMREEGKDIFADAEQELRAVTAVFVRAMEQRDFAALAAVEPYGFREAVDEEEWTREMVAREAAISEMVRAVKAIAGREEFKIDRDNYRASLTVEERYQFTYVLEVDGWKISGPLRVGP